MSLWAPHTIISDNGTNFAQGRWLAYAPSTRSPTSSPLLTTRKARDKLR